MKSILKQWDYALIKIKSKFRKKSAEEKKEETQEKDVKKLLKKKRKRRKNRQILKDYLVRAGLEHLQGKKIKKNILSVGVIVSAILTFVVAIWWFLGEQSSTWAILSFIAIWTAVLAAVIIISWVILYFALDIRIFNRTLQLEAVLPDFLQLTSSNISAGMPIDRALWYAVRPNFGVLAKEIEEVAKNTMAGEDLEKALTVFASKYDSKVLKRSINILLEGLHAGGEMADLLNKISINIQETRLLKKEMAANVMTYIIFIGFASIAAAPFLYALATVLLNVITTITAGMDLGASSGAISINVSESPISLSDFKIFASVMVAMTITFSMMIISVIRKGTVKQGLHLIPPAIIVGIGLYFLGFWAFDTMFSGFF